MKKILFMCILLALTVGTSGQRRMVNKPEKSSFETSMLAGKSLSVTFKDSRIIQKKTKVSATFEDVVRAITETLESAGATVKTGDEVVISVKQYEVFARGVVWIGITRYEVTAGDDKHEISGEHSEGNVLGVKTAKSVQRKSFDKANEALIKLFAEKL